jgi:hypothetical protein
MAEQSGQPRGPRTGVCPGTFDPIHNGHLDIIRRATLFDVVEDAHAAVARLVGAAAPNEPEPNGRGPIEPGPNSFGSKPGGGDPNEPSRTASDQTNPPAASQTNPSRTVADQTNPAAAAGSTRSAQRRKARTMAEPRGLRTGVCPGAFDPIHNGPLDSRTSGRCGRAK